MFYAFIIFELKFDDGRTVGAQVITGNSKT